MRKRRIQLYGNTNVIKLSACDLLDLNLKIGDYVDIEDIVKIKRVKKNGKHI
jgi:hypothetical protein